MNWFSYPPATYAPVISTISYASATNLLSSGLCSGVAVASITLPLNNLFISPNPFTENNLTFTFSSGSPSPHLLFTLTDITGRVLSQTQLNATTGINKKEMHVGDLAKGIYIVTLNGEEGSESVKVVKE